MRPIKGEAQEGMISRRTLCIGITGGVGSGKSSVLGYLTDSTDCRSLVSDDEAKKLYVPGSSVFDRIIETAGDDVLAADGAIDKKAFALKLFNDSSLRERINEIVHPAVRDIISDTMQYEISSGRHDYLFIEAALLIENGYEEVLDELWYIYASEETRRKRLKESRGYSDEKITAIFASQLSEEEYRKHCDRVIDNDGSTERMRASVDAALRAVREQTYKHERL